MSVTSMTTVFKAEINDLSYTKKDKPRIAKASTVKLLLLAYADCANDEGESAYPGFTLLEIKTALSRQGIADTIEACEQNSFLFPAGKSKRKTNSYRINLELLQTLVKPLDSTENPRVKWLDQHESSGLTNTSQVARLNPSSNHHSNHPLKNSGDSATPKASQIPELILFRSVTERYPARDTFEIVVGAIQKISTRLGRSAIREDILPFWQAWRTKGWRPTNLSWLTDWAVGGEIPQNGFKSQQQPISKAAARATVALDSLKSLSAKYAANGE